MGQYHVPVCIEAEEALNPHMMAVGLKEGEQGFSTPSTPHAMVALVCARGGNMPADCSQSTLVGKWAGKRVLVQGDYAEDDDIPGWDGPPLSLLYSATDDEYARREAVAYREKIRAEGMNYPPIDFSKLPIYADITREARDFLEGPCNVRYFEREQTLKDGRPGSPTYGQITSRWTSVEWVRVRPLAREFGGSGVAEYVLDPCCTADDLIDLKRKGFDPKDVMRPPRSGDWHGGLVTDITEGQTRVLANLDTLEYLDPVKFGQVPTLAGMVMPPPKDRAVPILAKAEPRWGEQIVTVAAGLFAMLCHPKRRGGGDIPANAQEMGSIDAARAKYAKLFKGAEHVKGRWRGGHILGTGGIRYDDWPTTEEVTLRGTDISDMVLRYLVAVSHY